MWFGIWQSYRGADLVLRQQFLWAGWLLVCATWAAKFPCGFSSKPPPPPAPLWGGSFFFSFLLSFFLPFYLRAINRFVSWSLCRVSALKTTSHLLVTERMWGMRPHGPSLPTQLGSVCACSGEGARCLQSLGADSDPASTAWWAAKERWQWHVWRVGMDFKCVSERFTTLRNTRW